MSSGKPKPTLVTTYSAGMQHILCNGAIDTIWQVDVDEKTITTAPITGTSRIYIDQPELFGGLKREGGIKGYVDFHFGFAADAPNSYLSSLLGSVPSYKGIVAVYLNRVWLGTNYYIKPWRYLVTRVARRQIEAAQWQPFYVSPDLPAVYDFLYTYTGTQALPENFGLTTANVRTGYFVKVSNIANPSNGNVYVVLSDSNLAVASSFRRYVKYPLINAVHVIRECLTDMTWGRKQDDALIHEASFLSAAQTCFNEGLGFS